jgi:hypothetical protein
MVIAIDFDGTIACYCEPAGRCNFGIILPQAKRAINKLRSEGHIIIINTTRFEVKDVKKYLADNGIEIDHINYNPENLKKGLSYKKVLADIYIDDRNISFTGDWKQTLIDVKNFKNKTDHLKGKCKDCQIHKNREKK